MSNQSLQLNNVNIIDLTHSLAPEVPYWRGVKAFSRSIAFEYSDPITGINFSVKEVKMMEGVGTHMDAPAEIIQDGTTIDQLPLSNFIAPCIVINISRKSHERYSLSVEDIKEFEAKYGDITSGSFVIIYTGWDQYWFLPEKYCNNHIFPKLSETAAQYLLDKDIVGLGIDTLSPDRSEDGFPVHKLILGAGKYIIENIANASKLPITGSYILAFPIKIQNSAEAPVRLVAIIPRG